MKLNTYEIRCLMGRKGMTARQVALAAGLCADRFSVIIKKGSCRPDTAGRLAAALGVDISDITVHDLAAEKGDADA